MLAKLLAIFLVVALGWVVGRMRWLGDERRGADPARTLSNAALYVFIPALLFRTTARLDFAALPWRTLAAFFVPVVALLLVVYAWQRRAAGRDAAPAVPSVRAISVSFGNTLQLGVPMAAALFGEAGLGIHVTIVSLHALILLTVVTTLVELDLARASATTGVPALVSTLATTARNTLVHPVVLPVVAGLAWNALGVALPTVVDDTLLLLGSAVVPLCLVLIGMSLAYYGVRGVLRGAVRVGAIKLLVLPALVLAVARGLFRLDGLALEVIVMMAALPVGSNALIFAQRYRTLETEATAAIVLSTFAFGITAPMWVAVLAALR